MTISDYELQLQSVNKAITAIENGAQEYRLGSRMVRRADLSVLYSERRRLEGLCSQANGGTTFAVIMR